jgi:hypothetical protein
MITILRRVGFTEQEAKMCLAQLCVDSATDYPSSKTSDVPRTRPLTVNTLRLGDRVLECGNVVYHPSLKSQLQRIAKMLLVVAVSKEKLIASKYRKIKAIITLHVNLILSAWRFVSMELFFRRIYIRFGNDLIEKLELQNPQVFESLYGIKEAHNGERNMDKRQHY